MAADVGQASACAGLQSRWRDSYERCGRRAKAPPQAEAFPTCTGGPTLARKCEVIPAPALSRRKPRYEPASGKREIHRRLERKAAGMLLGGIGVRPDGSTLYWTVFNQSIDLARIENIR